jgi:uncharacterized protein
MKALKWIAATAAIAYLIVLLTLFIFQRSFLYAPDRNATTPANAGLADFAQIRVEAKHGALTSWWHPPVKADAPIILIFHGNGGALAGRAMLYKGIAGKDFGILAVGYPGYGGNPGTPSEQSLYGAAQANYDWLIAKGYKPEQIIIAGQSLGTGVAIWLAHTHPAAGLLLQSPYTSMVEMAARQMPFAPAQLLLKDRYDSLSRIGQIKMPVAWIHGRDDSLIPLAMAKRLFDEANAPKCSHIIPGAGHNDMPDAEVATFFRLNVEAMVKEGKCFSGVTSGSS